MSTESEESIVEARDPLLGVVVQDRYRVVRKLGEGGMGRVYEGEHLLVKRRVAIKCLHAQFASNAEVLQRFLREAQAASAIGNEHIVDVIDMGRLPDGAPFMVMEYLEGRSLGDVITEDGPLTIGRAVRIMRQICASVEAAHAKSIVHRDLKPDNVFLIRRGDDPDFVKVLDFGIAKFLNDASGARTGTGVMVGTISFMAPEQVEGLKDIDHRADLYALGGILFTALTQRLPFEAESIARLAYEVCMVPAPDVRALRPDLPAPLGGVVQHLLAKSRAERIQSCAALRDALAPYASLDDAPTLSASPTHAYALGETLASAPGLARSPSELGAGSLVGAEVPLRTDRPWSRWAALSVGVVVLGAGLVVGWSRGRDRAPQRPVTALIPPPSVPSSPASAATGTVHVFVQVSPEIASLLVDGRPVANPWDVDLPASATPRHIEARAEGYEPWSTDITLEYPQRVNRALRPLLGDATDAGATAATAPSSSEERGRSGRRRSHASRQDSPPPTAVESPTPAPSAPPSAPSAPTAAGRTGRGQLMTIDLDER